MKKFAGIILMLIGLIFMVGIVMDGVDQEVFGLLFEAVKNPGSLTQTRIDRIVGVFFPNLIYGAGALGCGWAFFADEA